MLNFKLFYLRNQINSLLKTPMLYALLINILIRIPYFPHAQGSDAFVVAWMAQAIKEGFIEAWIIHPLSIFGLYPYSFYPIGGPFILSLIFRMGFDIDDALFLFSFLFMMISLITTYYLGKLIFSNEKLSIFFFVVFYTTSPIFLRYTYWTATVRGPFMAILPLTLFFLLKITKEFNLRNIIGLFVSIVILAFMHRLIILYPIYIISLFLAIILFKMNFLSKKYLPVYLISYFCAFIFGILVFPINPRITAEFILNNDSIIGVAWNLMIDYALKFGIISLFSVWGFINQFFINESDKNEAIIRKFFLILGLFLIFISPISIYTSIILLPWIGYYAILGLKSILALQLGWIKYLIGILPSFFGLFYFLIVADLPIHLISAIILALGSLIIIIIKQRKISEVKNDFFLILCIAIIIFSKTSTDGLIISSNFPFNYISDDEFIIAKYLEKYNSKQEIIAVYHSLVARRIQAIGSQPVISPKNYAANLYFGWISAEEIHEKTIFDISQVLKLGVGIPFITNRTIPENDMFYYASRSDLRDIRGLERVYALGIRYVVISNLIFEELNPNLLLFTSVLEMGVLRAETRYLKLYEIPEIHV
ncbi:MAG: hypothetical protein ACFFAU_17570 [Candidatus Hodarchaeota archaeon]